MEVVIDPHALARAAERGANKEEIKKTLREGIFSEVKMGRKDPFPWLLILKINGQENIMSKKRLRLYLLKKNKKLLR